MIRSDFEVEVEERAFVASSSADRLQTIAERFTILPRGRGSLLTRSRTRLRSTWKESRRIEGTASTGY